MNEPMKYKYSLNAKNQLFIKSAKENLPIPARGSFSLDENNQLIYWLNEPASWRRLYNLPSKVYLVGNWKLNSDYDLEFILEETKNQYKDERLVFKGEIISTDRDTLVFETISQDEDGNSHIQLLKLSGSWQADEFNRIIFKIKKDTSPDVITLEGIWQINRNQQVTYCYERTGLKRKTGISRVLTFEGFWQINSANRLRYILSRSTQSYFDFRVQIESPNLYPKEGTIKYRIGIGLKENNPSRMRTIFLYGSWRFSRNAGLVFSMDYGKGKLRDIELAADIHLNKRDEVIFSLTDKERKPLGLNVAFNHAFLKNQDAQAFLKLKNILDKKEAAIEAGVRIPF